MINNLGGNISDEDSKLVDSILNDLNMGEGQAPPEARGPQGSQEQQMPQQGATPEQKQEMMARQQAIMAQQQQIQQNQQMQMQQNMNVSQESLMDSMIEKVRNESKSIMLVIFLAVLFNIEQVNGIFKKWPSIFIVESTGVLNLQGIFVKALCIGVVYFLIKSQFF